VKKPIIAISMGDPSGIGPEVILKALASPQIRRLAFFLVVGDAFTLGRTAKLMKRGKAMLDFHLLDLGNVRKKGFRFGKLSAGYGRASFEYIKTAVDIVKQGVADALVTAPINKEALSKAGLKYNGHTELLARFTGAKDIAMMLTGGPLRVVLVTRHVSLRGAVRKLNTKDIFKAIKVAHDSLKKQFRIRNPKIAVCGLNPHAGESGNFGSEETKIIKPAIARAKRAGVRRLIGPIPSDTLFYRARTGEYDAIICMYHDQGLIPLKMLARDAGVNITLGLPIVRTSPAHGTAFDIAGKSLADPGSMIEAIKTAAKLCK